MGTRVHFLRNANEIPFFERGSFFSRVLLQIKMPLAIVELVFTCAHFLLLVLLLIKTTLGKLSAPTRSAIAKKTVLKL